MPGHVQLYHNRSRAFDQWDKVFSLKRVSFYPAAWVPRGRGVEAGAGLREAAGGSAGQDSEQVSQVEVYA